MDRLIEQSPPIPTECIQMFELQFGHIKELKKPDICGALEHTRVFESSEERLKQVAVDAALLLKHKKNTLNELLAPQIQVRIKEQVETRIKEALEEQKIKMMKEIEEEKIESQRSKEDFDKIMENRQKKIQEEIELEKKKMVPSGSPESLTRELPFEKRFYTRKHSTDSFDKWSTKKSPVLAPTSPQSTTEFLLGDAQNTVLIPNSEQVEIQVDHTEENEHKN